eukprot:946001-Pyramimonas_sp.AAC.1
MAHRWLTDGSPMAHRWLTYGSPPFFDHVSSGFDKLTDGSPMEAHRRLTGVRGHVSVNFRFSSATAQGYLLQHGVSRASQLKLCNWLAHLPCATHPITKRRRAPAACQRLPALSGAY